MLGTHWSILILIIISSSFVIIMQSNSINPVSGAQGGPAVSSVSLLQRFRDDINKLQITPLKVVSGSMVAGLKSIENELLFDVGSR